MLQKLKMGSLSKDYINTERRALITINPTKLRYLVQCVALFMIPVGAVALSIASDYLFFEEILSAAFLITLVLFIKVAGGKS